MKIRGDLVLVVAVVVVVASLLVPRVRTRGIFLGFVRKFLKDDLLADAFSPLRGEMSATLTMGVR